MPREVSSTCVYGVRHAMCISRSVAAQNRSRYAEVGVHAAAIRVTLALSRGRDRIDQPVEMEPHHARVPPDERNDGEKQDIADDEGDEDVPSGPEPDGEDDEREDRDTEGVARDHRAGPVPRLPLEPE